MMKRGHNNISNMNYPVLLVFRGVIKNTFHVGKKERKVLSIIVRRSFDSSVCTSVFIWLYRDTRAAWAKQAKLSCQQGW